MLGILDFLKEFSLKGAIYAVPYAWNCVNKSTVANVWHRLWPTVMQPANGESEGFHATNDKQMISNMVTYAKVHQPKV